jgi:hypothetical protein
LNREKWEREVAYLDRLRGTFEVSVSTCTKVLNSFGKRVLRGRS